MTASLKHRADTVEGLLREAGQQARFAARRRGELSTATKSAPLDIVTEADTAIEAFIRGELAQRYPEDRFWGEEAGAPDDPARGSTWICDPIDGTRGFLRFGVSYCISLGFLSEGRTLVGGIYDPECDDYYAATAGGGATLNGKPLALPPLDGMRKALVGIGYSERISPERHAAFLARLLATGAMMHQHGSGALSIAQVAAGRLDAYVELHLNAWDALPGLLIAREAGAACGAWDPSKLLKGQLVIAANAGIAEQIKGFVQPEGDFIWAS